MPFIQKQFTSWSFTRYSDWLRCPAYAKYKHLEKVQTLEMAARDARVAAGEETSAMLRGAEIAKKAEVYLKNKRKPLPIELMPVAAEYKALRARATILVEDNWGFTKDWKPCSPTDWNNCWLRVKIDACYTTGEKELHIKDNKTGKYDDRKVEEYKLQLELYGVGGLAKMPTVQIATAQLIYSDLGILHPEKPMTFTRAQFEPLKKKWVQRVKPLFADKKFAPRPGYYCRWCDFAKVKGGPCKF